MKNFLNYNYNLLPEKIYDKDGEKYFFIKEYKIYIMQYDDVDKDIDKITEISNNLFSEGLKINTILRNKYGKYVSKYKNKNLILIRVNSIENDELVYTDILKLKNKNKIYELKKINLIEEWVKEIDLLEKELLEYNDEYLMIKETFDYCIGCAENAIQLYKTDGKKQIISLGHFNCPMLDIKNYSNPKLLCNIDFNYELASYIKSKFIQKKINYDELYIILKNCESPNCLYSCLLYPSYYFYLLRKMILEPENKQEKDKFIKYGNQIKNYKKLLSFIKNQLRNSKEIQLLDWINE